MSATNVKLSWQTLVLYGFHVEIPLAIFLASPFSWQYSLFLPSSITKASTKEQIASQCRDINSHNYKGKFPKGMMAVNENSHGKKKAETPKVYGTD